LSEQASIASVLAGIARLEAENDILRTLHRYGHSIDAGRDEDWVDCFTEDGIIDVLYGADRAPTARLGLGTRHATGVRHQGREALRVFIAGHTHPPKHVHQHVLVEPRITVSGETGRGLSYMMRIDMLDPAPTITTFGRYLDRYRRTGEREWRIAERVCDIDGQRQPAAG
jgi:SnoaL-like domain